MLLFTSNKNHSLHLFIKTFIALYALCSFQLVIACVGGKKKRKTFITEAKITASEPFG